MKEKFKNILINNIFEFTYYYNNILLFSNVIKKYYDKNILSEKVSYIIVHIEWWNESFAESILLCKYLKLIDKNIKVIYYWAFVNRYSNDIIEYYWDFIDYIILNETEDIIWDIVNWKIIKDKIIDWNFYNKSVDFHDFHDYRIIKKRNIIKEPVEFEFSRWCIIDRCFYCMCTLWKKLRLKPLNLHIKHLTKLLFFWFNSFYYIDAEINSIKSYMYNFLNEYIKLQSIKPFIWSAYLIPKNISFDDLDIMYKAWCRHLRIWFESATQSRLDTIAKKTNLLEIIEIIKNCKKIWIKVQLHCIVWYPYEKQIEIENIMNFIKENSLYIDIMNFYQFKPRRTTWIYEKSELYKINIFEEKTDLYTFPFIKDNIYFNEKNNIKDYKIIYNKNKLKILLLEKFSNIHWIKNSDPKEYFKEMSKYYQNDK